MLWQLFWLQNAHYIIEVFVAFLMIISGWIYLDAWVIERRIKTLLRVFGLFVLALWSFIDAAPIKIEFMEKMLGTTGFLGFGLLFLSLLIDPVPLRPGAKTGGLFSRYWSKSFSILPFSINEGFIDIFNRVLNSFPSPLRTIVQRIVIFLTPIFLFLGGAVTEWTVWMLLFSAFTTFLLWVHYSRGIQSEWKYFYLGFLALTISLVFAFTSVTLQGSSNVLIASYAEPYHIAWALEHIAKFLGTILLGAWAWGFIRFRIFPQIFTSFIALTFFTFIIMTILYTGFLLNRTQATTLSNLETNVKTLQFAIAKIKESAILAARLAANNPQIQEAVRRDDKEALFKNLNLLMFENETDFMTAINKGGEALMRAEDKERFGDSLADDPVIWRALDGKSVVTMSSEKGVTLPTVLVKASSPIINTSEGGEPEIIGAVVTGFLLDTAFVDGIKKITNLDVTIFANDIQSASTFTIKGGQTRLIGIRELNKSIIETVLKKNQVYTGEVKVLNEPYLAAYVPIRDIEETSVGMFFTGKSQASILTAAADTMRFTFIISLILMIISLVPLRWLARFISRHQEI